MHPETIFVNNAMLIT